MSAESIFIGLADRLRNLESKWNAQEAAALRQWLEKGNFEVIKPYLLAYLSQPPPQSLLQPIKRPTGFEMAIQPKISDSQKRYKDLDVQTTTTIPELRQIYSRVV